MTRGVNWSKVWVIRDAEDGVAKLLPTGSKFWLEPVRASGGIAYYCLRADPGGMKSCFIDQNFYPIGFTGLSVEALPAWHDDEKTRAIFQAAAVKVREAGRADHRVERLEAVIKTGKSERRLARIYCFPGAEQDGRDWMVFDLIGGASARHAGHTRGRKSDGPVALDDGTANGDPGG